jgi:hypothetical protein
MNKKEMDELIQMFKSDVELHEELDWWCHDDKTSYNIHNFNSDDIAMFKIDAYPNAEGQDKPDYTTWTTVKTFHFHEGEQND